MRRRGALESSRGGSSRAVVDRTPRNPRIRLSLDSAMDAEVATVYPLTDEVEDAEIKGYIQEVEQQEQKLVELGSDLAASASLPSQTRAPPERLCHHSNSRRSPRLTSSCSISLLARGNKMSSSHCLRFFGSHCPCLACLQEAMWRLLLFCGSKDSNSVVGFLCAQHVSLAA